MLRSPLQTAARPATTAATGLEQFYEQFAFFGRALASLPRALRHRGEIIAEISNVTVGIGAFVVGGGMFFVVFALSSATGYEVGLESFSSLQGIGAQAFIGVVASGAGFTAEIGAMRVSEEIDALEVIGVESVAYVVGTRIWAAVITMVPLYLAAIFASYLGTQLISTKFFGLPLGVYQHYFNLLLPPIDVLFSFIQVVVFAVVVTLVHCYYGYYATGGPVGVGTATGRAIRFSFMSIAVLNMVLSFAFYGSGGARLVG
ncbi:MAG: ABC transporter permease [Actinobacteria bacterium]|nr:MAG: ABC transporter permease [Actinomycetota bacterium]